MTIDQYVLALAKETFNKGGEYHEGNGKVT